MKLTLFVFLIAFASLKVESKIVEKTISTIGEDVILLSELSSFRKQLRANLVPDSLLSKILPKKIILNNKARRLEFMRLQQMLSQIAANQKRPFKPKDFIVNGKIKLSRKNSKKRSASEKKIIKSLGFYELTLKEFWERVDSYSTNDRLLGEQVLSQITISDNELDAYHFNKHGTNLFQDFEYEFNSVSVPNNKIGQKKIAGFFRKLSTSSFNQIAKEKGLKIKTTKLKGSEINPTMYKSLKGLSVSQTSNPILLNNTLYLLKLKWKNPFLDASKQKRRAKIQKYLFEKELKKELKKWVENQKTAFSIKTYSY